MNETRFGFIEQPVYELPTLDAKLHEMEHAKTGAKLVWIERDEENKTFGIAFTTLPENDTGVFHILEHSVLCGSEKYPVKEPFVELLKNSMNTFLNAMTFPDKTFYPISSRNDKDFLNLTRVYLDAVLRPSIYSKPEIFHQEGWHYEFDENGTASYKGVVFNEMKGALANADRLEDMALVGSLFPETPYRFNAGGDPAKIPDLSYEEFIENHRRFYSPSNSFIFLDGKMDIDTVLKLIDEEYLCNFERSERVAPPAFQKPVDGGLREISYEIAPDESEEGHSRLVFGNVLCRFDESEKNIAMQILSDVLCGNNKAPLSRAILSQGLAEDVSLQVDDGVLQPWVKLELKNLDGSNIEKAKIVVREELERLARDGLDRTQLEAAITNLEFKYRERDFGRYPEGLFLGFQVLESWLYGGAPEAFLQLSELFEGLYKKLDTDYFEKLLTEVLLENPHRCTIVLTPSHSAGSERREQEAKRLQTESSLWTDSDKARFMKEQEILSAWQHSEDTPEQLATLPHLQLSDISDKPEELPTEELKLSGIPVLLHRINSNGIVYGNLFFDIKGFSECELSRLSLLCKLLGELRTEAHSAQELATLKRLLCGNLSFEPVAFEGENDTKSCTIKLQVSFSALEHKLEKALELVIELLTQTKFDDEDSISELLRQFKLQYTQYIVMSGNAAAFGRVAAQCSCAGAAREYINGFAFYEQLKKQESDGSMAELGSSLEAILSGVISKNRLVVSVTSENENSAEKIALALSEKLPENDGEIGEYEYRPFGKRREGIEIPADISFAARGGCLTDSNGAYGGEMALASNIIGLAYLWNAIRVQGGAYGVSLTVRESGFACCTSYRDPSGAKSIDTYLNCAPFLRQLCEGDPDLTGFIVGTVSRSSPLLTSRLKGELADRFYWQNISWERRCEIREELLSSTPEKLLSLCDSLESTITDGGICIIGGKNQLELLELDYKASL